LQSVCRLMTQLSLSRMAKPHIHVGSFWGYRMRITHLPQESNQLPMEVVWCKPARS
jgi:hypothetical protein